MSEAPGAPGEQTRVQARDPVTPTRLFASPVSPGAQGTDGDETIVYPAGEAAIVIVRDLTGARQLSF
jgi:hypothetical protein